MNLNNLEFKRNIRESVMIYCPTELEDEDKYIEIMSKLSNKKNVVKFNASEFKGAENIKNDSRLFIVNNLEGNKNVWQFQSSVTDFFGEIIPHVYNIRQIGTLESIVSLTVDKAEGDEEAYPWDRYYRRVPKVSIQEEFDKTSRCTENTFNFGISHTKE